MAGTRTAPTVDGATFTFIKVTLTWYDYTGEQRSDSYRMDSDSSSAEIEAFAAAMQAASNATLWRIQVSEVYNSVGDSSNALEEVWENAQDNLLFLFKDPSDNGFNIFIPSPMESMFIDATEELDPTNAEIIAVLASVLPMKATYAVVSGRMSHRRQIGKKINI